MVSPHATPVTIPSWVTLGQIVTAVGALIAFIGFIFGAAGVAAASSSTSTYQGDLETFFVLAGLGILLAIGGWLFDAVWPKYKSRPQPAPAVPPTVAPLPPPPPPPPA
ncbi:MAG TPA: hypothetical protein VEH28_08565 [Thermoplasmata archaeon]|nr:hypothetical protein [Thermoplasmata archaeon]